MASSTIKKTTSVETASKSYSTKFGVAVCEFRKYGKLVHFRISINTTATTTAGTNYILLDSFPSGFAPRTTLIGIFDRNDTGHQGYGFIHLSKSSISYIPMSAGLSGVNMIGNVVYETE